MDVFISVKEINRLISKGVQGVSREGKKFCILYELGNKMQPGVWVHCDSVNGFSGGIRVGGNLEKFTIFSLKLL